VKSITFQTYVESVELGEHADGRNSFKELIHELQAFLWQERSCPCIAGDFSHVTSQMWRHGDVEESLWLISIGTDANGLEDNWCDKAAECVTDETKVDEGVFVDVSQDVKLKLLREGREGRGRHYEGDERSQDVK
jgi:hypothetical protein